MGLEERLNNWGAWLRYDIKIGPDSQRCISLESRYLPEAGEVWEEDPAPPNVVPDCRDAEVIHKLIQSLPKLERIALELYYGGHQVFIRHPRIGEYAAHRLRNNAEILLSDMIKSIDKRINFTYPDK